MVLAIMRCLDMVLFKVSICCGWHVKIRLCFIFDLKFYDSTRIGTYIWYIHMYMCTYRCIYVRMC